MPEGDSVRRTANLLDRALAGRRLTRSDFRWPSLATVDLAGATVLGTATYGKHLLTRLDHDGRSLTLHTHLKMEGSWRVARPNAKARVVLAAGDVQVVGVSLGIVELLRTADEHRITDRLGPDLLDPGHDRYEGVRRLLARPTRVLGEALLDQGVVAGLGTIYVSEACFVHVVPPRAPAGELRDPAGLLETAARLLADGVRDGRPPARVYRRHRHPCPRCGTTIQAGSFGPPGRERTLYWCPRCQA